MSEVHHLKTVQPYFYDVISGRKTFEVRKNDRNFKVGDMLMLEEYIPMGARYTGIVSPYEITYILDSPEYCKAGYVVLGIKPPKEVNAETDCPYCKQAITSVKMNFETDSILGESKWFSSTRSPKFCPMCGRRL